MITSDAFHKAGRGNIAAGRVALAKLLGVEVITTYHWKLDGLLPDKHLRYLRAIKPTWFKAQKVAGT